MNQRGAGDTIQDKQADCYDVQFAPSLIHYSACWIAITIGTEHTTSDLEIRASRLDSVSFPRASHNNLFVSTSDNRTSLRIIGQSTCGATVSLRIHYSISIEALVVLVRQQAIMERGRDRRFVYLLEAHDVFAVLSFSQLLCFEIMD